MTKEIYLNSLEDIIQDDLFITDNIELLNNEISTNCWSISIDQETVVLLTIQDLELFLNRVKENRLIQLKQSKLNIGLIFYLWFDEQSSQLKFNFINSNHKALPFKAKIELVSTSADIIQDFLNSKHHDGIPWDELKDVNDESIDDYNDKFIVKVYKELIKKLHA